MGWCFCLSWSCGSFGRFQWQPGDKLQTLGRTPDMLQELYAGIHCRVLINSNEPRNIPGQARQAHMPALYMQARSRTAQLANFLTDTGKDCLRTLFEICTRQPCLMDAALVVDFKL